MWYADKVGQLVPYLGDWPEGYKSREPAGFINVVRHEDAELVAELEVCEIYLNFRNAIARDDRQRYLINPGTRGIEFDDLRVGQRLIATVNQARNYVTEAELA